MLFRVASYCSTFMWQSVQMAKVLRCHVGNCFATLIGYKDTLFSRHTIKMPRFSSYLYYNGLGTPHPREPNKTLLAI